MSAARIEIIVESDGDSYHAFSPQLEGLHTAGESVLEALQNAGDALSAYMASVAKHGDAVLYSSAGVAVDAHYDEAADVLYLSFDGPPQEAISLEPIEGVLLRLGPDTRQLVGLTIIGYRERRWTHAERE